MFAFIDKEQTISVNTDNITSIRYYLRGDSVEVEVGYNSGKFEGYYEIGFSTPEEGSKAFHEQTNKSKEP